MKRATTSTAINPSRIAGSFPMSDVTRILSQIEQGDAGASEKLLPLVYDELRKLAAARLAQEKPGQTLQATALVHEAYLRLVAKAGVRSQESGVSSHNSGGENPSPDSPVSPAAWDSRGHFFAAAAEAMRRLLVENARRKRRQGRDNGQARVDLRDCDAALDGPVDEVLAIDDALTMLAEEDPHAAELVKLRYFGGLSIEEAAAALGIARATAYRHWTYARAWIRREILGD
jgi:RNA polymerase sigma factor (sigma-70 family)